MKPRKILVTLELKSDCPLKLMRQKDVWQEVMTSKFDGINEVHQVKAQAVKEDR